MRKVYIVFGLITAIQLMFFFYFTRGISDKKIAYADVIQLFNGYKYKTDMENASKATLEKLKYAVDSVGVIYKVNPNNPELQRQLMEKQQQLSDGYNMINKEINEKVWERLNPIIQEFGKLKDIEILVGGNGTGTVLYASKKKDLTEDLIKYANEHYEKGN